MDAQKLISQMLGHGAHFVAPVKTGDIAHESALRELCVQNKCGCYGMNWGCPPGCGDLKVLTKKLHAFEHAIVFQRVSDLADPFDWEGMQRAGKDFSALVHSLAHLPILRGNAFLLLGAGSCSHCKACAYPLPCPHPEQQIVSVEAFGINVSQLCSLAGLAYIHGQNTMTNIGLLAYDPAR